MPEAKVFSPKKNKPRYGFSKAEIQAMETHAHFSRPDVKAKEAAAIQKLDKEILTNKIIANRDRVTDIHRRAEKMHAAEKPTLIQKIGEVAKKKVLGEPKMQEFITRATKTINNPEIRTMFKKRAGALSRFVRPIRRML